MSVLKEKRKRSANWEDVEKKLLRDLVKERLDIIESKVAAPNAQKEKKLAWAEILRKFNLMNNKERVSEELITQWRNMKNKAKRAESSYRREMKGTGGGPPPENPSPEDMEIVNMIPHEFIIDNNVYDSDTIYKKQKVPEMKADSATVICESQILTILDEDTQPKMASTQSNHSLQDTQPKMASTQPIHSLQDTQPKLPLTQPNPVFVIEEPPLYASDTSFVLPEDTKITKRKKVKPQHNRYDTEVLLLMKKEKEEKISHEVKEHNLRMQILELEKEYWTKKIQKLDGE